MGIFDKLRKKNNQPTSRSVTPNPTTKPPFNLIISATKDGRCQIEFEDHKANDFKQFYDTTRLIINGKPIIIKGHTLYDCDISWYGSTDAILLGPEGEKYGRRNQYENILAEIDINQIQIDGRYCQFVMRQLLNRKRVLRYLEKGLRESPDTPCGKYIGGIQMTSNGYAKVFNQYIGNIAHNTNEMKMQREIYKRQEEQRKAAEIAEKQQQIRDLQKQIEELS